MKDEKPTDSSVFFILGCSLIAIGMSLISSIGFAFVAFLGCGAVFMIIGLTNRDKWEKAKKTT